MSAQERMDYAGAQLKEVRDIVSSQKSEIDELRDESDEEADAFRVQRGNRCRVPKDCACGLGVRANEFA